MFPLLFGGGKAHTGHRVNGNVQNRCKNRKIIAKSLRLRFAFWRNRYLYVAALPHAVARRKERGWPRVRSGDENPQAGRTASRLRRGKLLGRPRTLGCGAENISAGRARKRRFSGAGTTAAARKICRRSSGIPAAGRTVFLWWPENFSAGRARKRRFSGTGTTAAARKICRWGSGPVRSSRCPPPSGDGSYSASVKAMPCSASSE